MLWIIFIAITAGLNWRMGTTGPNGQGTYLMFFDSDKFEFTMAQNISALDLITCRFGKSLYLSLADRAFREYLGRWTAGSLDIFPAEVSSFAGGFVTEHSSGHWLVSEINWPNISAIFTFKDDIRLVYLSLVAGPRYIFAAMMDDPENHLYVMTNYLHMEIERVYQFKHQIMGLQYWTEKDKTYIFNQSLAMYELGGELVHTFSAQYIYASSIYRNKLYMVCADLMMNTIWVEFDLVTRVEVTKKLPGDFIVSCLEIM